MNGTPFRRPIASILFAATSAFAQLDPVQVEELCRRGYGDTRGEVCTPDGDCTERVETCEEKMKIYEQELEGQKKSYPPEFGPYLTANMTACPLAGFYGKAEGCRVGFGKDGRPRIEISVSSRLSKEDRAEIRALYPGELNVFFVEPGKKPILAPPQKAADRRG